MGYVVYVRSPGERFQQWTRKVHSNRANAIIEMNKGKATYKGYEKKAYMRKSIVGSKWVVRKTSSGSSSSLGSNLRMPNFRL